MANATFRSVLAAAALVVAAPGGHAATQVPRPVRVAPVADWQLKYADYWWLSSHEVLFLRGAWKRGWTYYRLDVRSGKEDRLSGITSRVRRGYGVASFLSLSPDRRTVLLNLFPWREVGVSLDGRVRFRDRFETRAPGRFSHDAYMGSDSRWVEAVFPVPVGSGTLSGLLVHDGKAARVTKRVTFRPPLVLPEKGIVTADNRFLFAGPEPSALSSHAIEVTQVTLGVAHPEPRSWRIALPGRIASAYGVQCSRQGQRLAWLAETRSPSRPGTVSGSSGPRKIEVWTSGLHGEGMHRVCTLPYKKAQLAPSSQLKLRWLPGGNALSFVRDGALWTVPVG